MTTPTNTKSVAFSNASDYIDSRDIIERIEELSELIDGEGCGDTCADYQEEYNALQAFAKQFEDYAEDYQYGVQAIRESSFEQAMDELIDDCYDLPDIPSFMTVTLDYDMLMQDYSAIDFDGVTYYVR